jgi:xanthine dehydrogenase YagR molybdenum-binding subunit
VRAATISSEILADRARSADRYFADIPKGELEFRGGLVSRKGAKEGRSFADVLGAARMAHVEGRGESAGTFGAKKRSVATHSYGAHFVEVAWQPQIARLRVNRVVTVIDAGRIINPLTGRNQIEGAIVMGVGMAIFEENHYDNRNGMVANSNLADYIVTTHADSPQIEVEFLDYPDFHLNALGARGIGEIGLAGFAAAVTNAVYHATGVRVRALPVRIEDLLNSAVL